MSPTRFQVLSRIAVVVGSLFSIALLLIQSFLWSALWLSGTLFALCVWRFFEPEPSTAWFVIRSKRFDVMFIAFLAIGLAVLALWVPAAPSP